MKHGKKDKDKGGDSVVVIAVVSLPLHMCLYFFPWASFSLKRYGTVNVV